MKTASIFLSLALVTCLVAPLNATLSQWEFLGERTVNYKSEFDTISVGARDGTFKRLKLKVKKSGIHFIDLKVHYANGDIQDVPIRAFVKAGGESRIIDLKGRNRVIAKVVFRYKTTNQRRGKAMVRLFGKH